MELKVFRQADFGSKYTNQVLLLPASGTAHGMMEVSLHIERD